MLKSVWSYVRWGICLTRPVLASVRLLGICLDDMWLGSFSYTPRALICLVVRQERRLSYTPGNVIFLVLRRVGSFSHMPRVSSFIGRGISLTCSVLVALLGSWDISLTRPVMESVWSFGVWGVSLTRPVLETVWSFVGRSLSLTRPVLTSVYSFVG